MYVSWEDFSDHTLGSTDGDKPDYTEDTYNRLAPMADALIDNWTLGRVGRAVRNGETLPDSVVTLYVAIIEQLPAVIENGKVSKGGLVSSFSNGIDSFTFETTKKISDTLYESLGWMVDLLPIEWCSAVVSFEGGNKYAG